MRYIYTLLLILSLPVVILRLLIRSLKAPEYRNRLLERFGQFSSLDIEQSIWIHSVSVGETQAAEPLIKALMEKYPDLPIVVTTTTPTGSARVNALFGSKVYHTYFPYDLSFSIHSFVRHTKPRLLIMMETEIWPNLLAICSKKGIPTILANARLSERSAKGYARFGSFARETFGYIGLVAAQAPADAERFLGLGVPSGQVRVTGSIKFDLRLPASLREQADVLRRQWGDRSVWVAASTHEGEDEQVLEAHRLVMQQQPDALLVLVPRHPERFDRVAALCVSEGFSLARRSASEPCGEAVSVFLGDTMGELTLFLGAADVAFVGGSLVATGGHNVLEPAALGVPVVFGPHMFNFEAISRMLLAEEAAVEVVSAHELAVTVSSWLGDASERTRIGENGGRMVESNRGALERLLSLIEDALGKGVS
ncbi:MAG: lipid IV(A) 3-deoxy-D-manno-octulosonic acid transferase [Candidatus Sedimenticola sp. (ex Thyasira tokunagai)]